jgi:hypothetical protein
MGIMKLILTVVSVANRGLVERCKLVVGLWAIILLIGVTGCSDSPDQNSAGSSSQKQNASSKNDSDKPKTVIVNKGLSKQEEKKLNERLDELEEKVEEPDKEGSQTSASPPAESSQPESSEQQVEDQVRAAAESYYQAVAARDWGYTYSHLDSETQSAFTRDEWFAKNEWLADAGPVTYTIQSVAMDPSFPESVANVEVLLTSTDGSTSVRNTYFVYEDGGWKHRFGPEEYELLANAKTKTPSASSSASISSSATASSSSSASPNPSPNRNNKAPRANVPGNRPAAPSGGGDIDCDEVDGPIPTPPGDPDNLDGDGDGLACE